MKKLILAIALAFAAQSANALPCAGFNDVDSTSASCPAIEWVKNRGISLGCAVGMYCPTATLTREQMAIFLYRAANSPEIISVRDRTEQESDTWASNVRVCNTTITAKPYNRTVLTVATLAMRYIGGLPGTRWPVEWQAQYSFDNGTTWFAANEMAYADTSSDWFFGNTDSGNFNIPANVQTLVGIRLFYLGTPVWGHCNYTLTVHALAS